MKKILSITLLVLCVLGGIHTLSKPQGKSRPSSLTEVVLVQEKKNVKERPKTLYEAIVGRIIESSDLETRDLTTIRFDSQLDSLDLEGQGFVDALKAYCPRVIERPPAFSTSPGLGLTLYDIELPKETILTFFKTSASGESSGALILKQDGSGNWHLDQR